MVWFVLTRILDQQPTDFYWCLGDYSKTIVPKAFVGGRARLFRGWEMN